MSFDIVIQRFIDGEPAAAESEALRNLLAPYVARTEAEFDFAELHFDDGTTDLYGIGEPGTGFMVNHVGGESAWAVLAEVAAAGGMTILAPGVPPMIFSETMRSHLPGELADEAVVISSGAEVLRTIVEA